LNQDFIAYKENVCYRRNEVWIRRGATSDLATPEEISRLVQGSPIEDIPPVAGKTVYSRLSKEKQLDCLFSDVARCIEEADGKVYGDRFVVKVKRTKLVLRVLVVRSLDLDWDIWYWTTLYWAYEHGLLIISLDSFTKKSFPNSFRINSKEQWGWFSVFDIGRYGDELLDVPLNTMPVSPFILTLPQVKDSARLQNKFVFPFPALPVITKHFFSS